MLVFAQTVTYHHTLLGVFVSLSKSTCVSLLTVLLLAMDTGLSLAAFCSTGNTHTTLGSTVDSWVGPLSINNFQWSNDISFNQG